MNEKLDTEARRKSKMFTGVTNQNPKPGKRYTEKAVAERLRLLVKTSGGLIFKMHPLTEKGIPDYIVHAYNGKTFYVETKTTNERCAPIQIEFHRMLKMREIETYVLDVVVDNYNDIFAHSYTTYPGIHFKPKKL